MTKPAPSFAPGGISVPMKNSAKPDTTPEQKASTEKLISKNADLAPVEPKKAVGRPPKADALTARLHAISCTPQLKEQITVLAEHLDRSEAWVMRTYLEKAIAHQIAREELEHKLKY